MAFGEGFTAQTYEQSHGRDLYRRSMYTFWKRTCRRPRWPRSTRRTARSARLDGARTNTPLQALVLMNDPTYVEAAGKLAERALTEGGRRPASRLAYAFRLATTAASRPAEETKVLRDASSSSKLAAFRSSPKTAAAKLLAVGESPRDPSSSTAAELAAWTTVASVILNLDETDHEVAGLPEALDDHDSYRPMPLHAARAAQFFGRRGARDRRRRAGVAARPGAARRRHSRTGLPSNRGGSSACRTSRRRPSG